MKNILSIFFFIGLATVGATLVGCFGRAPVPEQLKKNDLVALGARMQQAQSALTNYVAEATVTYFGKEGRVRSVGSIAVQRPMSLRYEANGPHGGVVSAFATNGLELQALDVARSRFVYGKATPDNLDRLLPFAAMGLTTQEWLRLFFGEVEVSPASEVSYDESAQCYVLRWVVGDGERRVMVDPINARVLRAEAWVKGARVSEVRFLDRDHAGVPTSFRLSVAPSTELEIKLRELEGNVTLEPATFLLEAPAGVVGEHL